MYIKGKCFVERHPKGLKIINMVYEVLLQHIHFSIKGSDYVYGVVKRYWG